MSNLQTINDNEHCFPPTLNEIKKIKCHGDLDKIIKLFNLKPNQYTLVKNSYITLWVAMENELKEITFTQKDEGYTHYHKCRYYNQIDPVRAYFIIKHKLFPSCIQSESTNENKEDLSEI